MGHATERPRGLQRERDDPHRHRLDQKDAVEAGQPEAGAVALAHRDVAGILALAVVAPADVQREPAAPDRDEHGEQDAAAVVTVADRDADPGDDDEADYC